MTEQMKMAQNTFKTCRYRTLYPDHKLIKVLMLSDMTLSVNPENVHDCDVHSAGVTEINRKY